MFEGKVAQLTNEQTSPVVQIYLDTLLKLRAIDSNEARSEIARIVAHLKTLGVAVKGSSPHTEDYSTLMPEVKHER